MPADNHSLPKRPRPKIDPALIVAILVGCIAGGFVVRYAAKTIPNRAVGGVAAQLAGDAPVVETPLQTLEAVGDVRGVGFAQDGSNVFIGDREGFTLRDPQSGKTLRTFDTDGNGVRSLAVSPDGKSVAVALSFTGEVCFYDANAEKPLLTFHNVSDKEQQSVAFAPDGGSIASGGFDQTVRIWVATNTSSANEKPGAVFDTTQKSGNGGKLVTATIKVGDAVNAVLFTPDGKTVAVATGPKVTLYTVADGKPGQTFFADKETVTAIAVTPNGKTLALGTSSGNVSLFDVATGRKEITITGSNDTGRNANAFNYRSSSGMGVSALAFLPDSKTLYITQKSGILAAYNAITGKAIKILAEENTPPALSFALSSDNKKSIVGYKDGSVRIWSL